MVRRHNPGFTLVELIVILGFLVLVAALVAPQFAVASSSSIKDSLRWQLGRASDALWMHQHELGTAPELGAGFEHDGWGGLVTAGYLTEIPFNPYVQSASLSPKQGQLAPGTLPTSGDHGWGIYRGVLFAVGYDPTLNLLSNEKGYLQRPLYDETGQTDRPTARESTDS